MAERFRLVAASLRRGSRFERRIATPLVEGVARLVSGGITLLAALMMLTLTWQVLARFVPVLPSAWTEELARYAFIFMTFLGAALAVKGSRHFGITIVTDRLRGSARDRYFRFILQPLILLASLLFLVHGTRYALEFGTVRLSPTFHIRMVWVFLALPLAALPMALFAAHNLLFGDYRHPEDPEEGAVPSRPLEE